jgi:RNA polymerase sigma factor (TIGR02999 family)
MPMDHGAITLLLQQARAGEASAADRLFEAVYSELKRLARSHRRRWQGNDTLNTTALIHEAYLKLAGRDAAGFANRTHFFATASKAMRHVLVNYAERGGAAKRGGNAVNVPLNEAALVADASADELLALNDLLSRLEADDPRRCRIVECRVFGGMTIDEIAQALDISPATVKREWRIATARLYQQLRAEPG